jgi:hypothetical protein
MNYELINYLYLVSYLNIRQLILISEWMNVVNIYWIKLYIYIYNCVIEKYWWLLLLIGF